METLSMRWIFRHCDRLIRTDDDILGVTALCIISVFHGNAVIVGCCSSRFWHPNMKHPRSTVSYLPLHEYKVRHLPSKHSSSESVISVAFKALYRSANYSRVFINIMCCLQSNLLNIHNILKFCSHKYSLPLTLDQLMPKSILFSLGKQ